jgi:hypothetical protein
MLDEDGTFFGATQVYMASRVSKIELGDTSLKKGRTVVLMPHIREIKLVRYTEEGKPNPALLDEMKATADSFHDSVVNAFSGETEETTFVILDVYSAFTTSHAIAGDLAIEGEFLKGINLLDVKVHAPGYEISEEFRKPLPMVGSDLKIYSSNGIATNLYDEYLITTSDDIKSFRDGEFTWNIDESPSYTKIEGIDDDSYPGYVLKLYEISRMYNMPSGVFMVAPTITELMLAVYPRVDIAVTGIWKAVGLNTPNFLMGNLWIEDHCAVKYYGITAPDDFDWKDADISEKKKQEIRNQRIEQVNLLGSAAGAFGFEAEINGGDLIICRTKSTKERIAVIGGWSKLHMHTAQILVEYQEEMKNNTLEIFTANNVQAKISSIRSTMKGKTYGSITMQSEKDFFDRNVENLLNNENKKRYIPKCFREGNEFAAGADLSSFAEPVDTLTSVIAETGDTNPFAFSGRLECDTFKLKNACNVYLEFNNKDGGVDTPCSKKVDLENIYMGRVYMSGDNLDTKNMFLVNVVTPIPFMVAIVKSSMFVNVIGVGIGKNPNADDRSRSCQAHESTYIQFIGDVINAPVKTTSLAELLLATASCNGVLFSKSMVNKNTTLMVHASRNVALDKCHMYQLRVEYTNMPVDKDTLFITHTKVAELIFSKSEKDKLLRVNMDTVQVLLYQPIRIPDGIHLRMKVGDKTAGGVTVGGSQDTKPSYFFKNDGSHDNVVVDINCMAKFGYFSFDGFYAKRIGVQGRRDSFDMEATRTYLANPQSAAKVSEHPYNRNISCCSVNMGNMEVDEFVGSHCFLSLTKENQTCYAKKITLDTCVVKGILTAVAKKLDTNLLILDDSSKFIIGPQGAGVQFLHKNSFFEYRTNGAIEETVDRINASNVDRLEVVMRNTLFNVLDYTNLGVPKDTMLSLISPAVVDMTGSIETEKPWTGSKFPYIRVYRAFGVETKAIWCFSHIDDDVRVAPRCREELFNAIHDSYNSSSMRAAMKLRDGSNPPLSDAAVKALVDNIKGKKNILLNVKASNKKNKITGDKIKRALLK